MRESLERLDLIVEDLQAALAEFALNAEELLRKNGCAASG
jgi:hypothetical protein